MVGQLGIEHREPGADAVAVGDPLPGQLPGPPQARLRAKRHFRQRPGTVLRSDGRLDRRVGLEHPSNCVCIQVRENSCSFVQYQALSVDRVYDKSLVCVSQNDPWTSFP